MSTDFAHTLRSLELRPRLLPWLLLLLVLLGGWVWWMGGTHVRVLVSSHKARVESTRTVHSVSAEMDGRLTEVHLRLGQRVQAGEVLAVLDDSSERTLLAEKRVALDALQLQVEALRDQVQSERVAQDSRRRVDGLVIAQTEVRLQRSREKAQTEGKLSSIAEDLHKDHLTTTVDLLHTTAERQDAELDVRDLTIETERMQAASELGDRNATARDRTLKRELVELEVKSRILAAEIATSMARLKRLEVRAPTDGVLGSVANVGPGDVVQRAQELATVVPDGELRLVAEFVPNQDGGRIRPGQRARARLDGFPWTQFGSLEAVVIQVAKEPRAGTHRVELSVTANAHAIPLQHGLAGELDIEVDSVTPWQMVLAETMGRMYPKPGAGPALAKER